MPIYCYACPKCGGHAETQQSINSIRHAPTCLTCKVDMVRDFGSENVNSGNKEYGQTKWSDSLAISPSQVEEHKRLFPDIRVDEKSGRIGFDNYQQHDKYLEKTGFQKLPQKIKRSKGKVIA